MDNDTSSKAVRQAQNHIIHQFHRHPLAKDYERLYDLLERLRGCLEMPEAARERIRPVMLGEIAAVLSAVHDPYTDDIA